jgi:diamine N-acetyltransferase
MSASTTKLRRATAADSIALAEIAEQTFRETFGSMNDESDVDAHCIENFGVELQLKEIEDSNVVTILVEVDDALAGFAQIRLYSPKHCVPTKHPSELHRIYISRLFHGLGIAQEMMREIFKVAKQTSSDCIWLGVWEQNPRAINFYEKYDFKVVGEHTFQFGSDPQRDLVMALELEGNACV